MERTENPNQRELDWHRLLHRQDTELHGIAEALGDGDALPADKCFLPFYHGDLLATVLSLEHFSPHDGWPIELTDRVKPILEKYFGDRTKEMPLEFMRELIPQATGKLFSTARIVHIEPVHDVAELVSGVALIETAPLFTPSELQPDSLLLALQQMHLDDHKGQSKLHLHPLALKGGVHLGYKLVFDPLLGQGWLSWEDHGNRAWKRAWSNPATTVLPAGTSAALHKASLAAVQADRKNVKVGMKFKEWAELFQHASKDAFVAHPEVGHPTPWPEPSPTTTVLTTTSAASS